MEKENNTNKIMQNIIDRDIKPLPKWKFVLQNYILYIISVFSVLVGAIAVATMIFSIDNYKWQYYRLVNNNFFSFIIGALPLIWIILLIVFSGIAINRLRATKKGYRHSVAFYTLIITFVSILLGIITFYLGLGNYFDSVMEKGISSYKGAEERMGLVWNDPDDGRLMGIIIKKNDETITIMDTDSQVWEVYIDTLLGKSLNVIENNDLVRIIGFIEKDDDIFPDDFHACVVLPAFGPGDRLPKALKDTIEDLEEKPRLINREINIAPKEILESVRNSEIDRINGCRDLLFYKNFIR
ncbi:MAG: hypothetical protein R3B64_01595 [Candidatus Paceibacterota bacterium]